MRAKYESRTLDYYDLNAEAFVSGTRTVDFLSQGYQMEATNGSVKLCRLASEYGTFVGEALFYEYNRENLCGFFKTNNRVRNRSF